MTQTKYARLVDMACSAFKIPKEYLTDKDFSVNRRVEEEKFDKIINRIRGKK